MIYVRKIFIASRRKVLSGLFTNLSAGWIGAVFIFPNFANLSNINNLLILIYDIILAIVCLLIAFWLEERRNFKWAYLLLLTLMLSSHLLSFWLYFYFFTLHSAVRKRNLIDNFIIFNCFSEDSLSRLIFSTSFPAVYMLQSWYSYYHNFGQTYWHHLG